MSSGQTVRYWQREFECRWGVPVTVHLDTDRDAVRFETNGACNGA